MDSNNSQLCRICIAPNSQMISIFGEDSLWQKITTLADVKIEKGDTLPQQVCINCAKNAISACLFKKKCEDADNFFRQQLLIQKIEGKANSPRDSKLGVLDREEANIVVSTSYSRDHSDVEEQHLQNGKHSYDEDIVNQRNGNSIEENNHQIVQQHHQHHQNQMLHSSNQIVEEDGEIKCANGVDKPPFDFQSIRLMHEYMQQQLCKFNGSQGPHMDGSHSAGSLSDGNGDDDEPLPLIPEIELITPSEDMTAAGATGNGSVAGMNGTGAPLRGYQCPNCYQIFEMKQILKAHMQSVHGTAGPVYECSNCKKTYFYKRFLEKHVRRGRCVKKRRNQTRPMQCSDCHVLFPTGHHLGWHKRTGCPSRAAKMPLQQLFKQNIVQYNNFPKRIGIRKPENAIYLHNRKLLMSNKRKGRTRIKLDAKKIALAKQLILREATTTVIANELNISRTFAWRLRKSLVNGVSLHERVIDPNTEEVAETATMEQRNNDAEKEEPPQVQQQKQHQQQQHLKYEENDEDDEEDDEDDDDDDEEDERERPSNEDDGEADGEDEIEDQHPAAKLLMNQNDDHLALAEQYAQLHQTAAEVEVGGEDDETETDGEGENNALEMMRNSTNKQKNRQPELQQHQQREQQQIFLQNMALHGVAEDKVAEAAAALKDLKYQKNFINGGTNGLPLVMPPLHPFPTGISMTSLPVNLSIRPLASLQKKETPPPPPPPAPTSGINVHHSTKKPRKPNVFIDDEKYAMAQTLVTQNASTMEIARALNVSQMTAWKVRDAIIKGVPLSYRNKRGEVGVPRPLIINKSDTEGTNDSHTETAPAEAEIMKAQLRLQQQEQLQQHLQQQLRQEEQQKKLLEQQLREQQQQQQQLKQLELLQQQQQQLQQEKLILQEQQRRRQEEQEQKLQKQLQQQQSLHLQPTTSNISRHTINNNNNSNNDSNSNNTKLIHPRRRLKAAERELRDKEITREILELIKEDSNIQYWKVSARLAEKGYPISPSSVCQKLKSMGIHRRWKPGDKPPLMLAPTNEQLKSNFNSQATAHTANSSSADESYDQQFEMGGAHFLSAFTR